VKIIIYPQWRVYSGGKGLTPLPEIKSYTCHCGTVYPRVSGTVMKCPDKENSAQNSVDHQNIIIKRTVIFRTLGDSRYIIILLFSYLPICVAKETTAVNYVRLCVKSNERA